MNKFFDGLDNNLGIVYAWQAASTGVYQPSSAGTSTEVMSAELPYEITMAEATIPMNYALLGDGKTFAGDVDMISYRSAGMERMDAKDIPVIAAEALKTLGLDEALKDAEVLFAPVTVAEVTDEGLGWETSSRSAEILCISRSTRVWKLRITLSASA